MKNTSSASSAAISKKNTRTSVLVVGGGCGGVGAALAVTAMGYAVVLTEETDWLGGQLTSQAVPPDEHPWIEHFGCTRRYREFRDRVREHYRRNHRLTPQAREDRYLNPGNGLVSALCFEPRVGAAVLEDMVAAARTGDLLDIRLQRKPVGVELGGLGDHRIRSVTFLNLKSGERETIEADYVLDASELGDLLPLAGCEYVSGRESRAQTGEPSALEGLPEPQSMQAITWCFAMSHEPGADHTISRPDDYEFWRSYVPDLDPPWPGPLLSWAQGHPVHDNPGHALTMRLFPEGPGDRFSRWLYRRIVWEGNFDSGTGVRDVTLVNWSQNDYFLGSVIDRPEEEVAGHFRASRELSLSLFYWLQTESPRPDGGTGYPGLYLRPDVMGTDDGLAKAAYIRESRRIQAVTTISECHVGVEARRLLGLPAHAERFPDSIGVGAYSIDLHPRCGTRSSGLNLDAYPFRIPLGAILPVRMRNLFAAGKNLGATHISNGCTRLHPIEWNVGESAGLLAAYCLLRGHSPHGVRENPAQLAEFHRLLSAHGVEIEMDWATIRPL